MNTIWNWHFFGHFLLSVKDISLGQTRFRDRRKWRSTPFLFVPSLPNGCSTLNDQSRFGILMARAFLWYRGLRGFEKVLNFRKYGISEPPVKWKGYVADKPNGSKFSLEQKQLRVAAFTRPSQFTARAIYRREQCHYLRRVSVLTTSEELW